MPTLRAPFSPHFELHMVGELLSRESLALSQNSLILCLGPKLSKERPLQDGGRMHGAQGLGYLYVS